MSPWVQIAVGSGGLVSLIIAIFTFLQNRRTMRLTQPKTDAERQNLDIKSLREIIAELRLARQDDEAEIQDLKKQNQRHTLLEKAWLQHDAAMSQFIVEHWRLEHAGEKPAPPIFQYVEMDTQQP